MMSEYGLGESIDSDCLESAPLALMRVLLSARAVTTWIWLQVGTPMGVPSVRGVAR